MNKQQFRKMLLAEEERSVIQICGSSVCKAKEGCNQESFKKCVAMKPEDRKKFVAQQLPKLNLMEGPLADLPDEANLEIGELGNLPEDTTAAQCGTGACTAEGCDDSTFFACFKQLEQRKMQFVKSNPQLAKHMAEFVKKEAAQKALVKGQQASASKVSFTCATMRM